ncbi:glycosyltransferase family 4 protein [Thomasclavelia cocleata]|uniref:glycosyltransferase family 4 protein n=1 Tax=Thomasclavelia cocleata TaxID=69824 RepID=UPI00242E620E|nr:glycosyltransferase family 4 protein [Thomasclavelia cocleata]
MASRADIDKNTNRLKILFLVNIPSPYRNDFFNELGKKCDLTVLFEKRIADDRKWQFEQSINYKAIYMNGKKTGPDTALCFEVIKYLKMDFDKIVVGGYSTPTGMLAITYLNLKKKKFYLNCDGGIIKSDSKINYVIKKYFIKSAYIWLSTGTETNRYLRHYGADNDRIYNYPFSSIKNIDILEKPLSRSQKKLLRTKLNINSSKMIISVGQFIERKGFDLLIRAAKDFSDIDFYLIGGKSIKAYNKLISFLNVKNIYFYDFMEKDRLYLYYQSADLMVFPTREDIWGLVINEAMANGLPIISTNKCNSAIELIKNNGIIIESDNLKQLKESIFSLMNNENQLLEMSNVSCKIIKNYTIESMAQKHIEIFMNT